MMRVMILEESGSPTLTGKPGNSMFEMKTFIVIWNILVRCQCGNCVMMPTAKRECLLPGDRCYFK